MSKLPSGGTHLTYHGEALNLKEKKQIIGRDASLKEDFKKMNLFFQLTIIYTLTPLCKVLGAIQCSESSHF